MFKHLFTRRDPQTPRGTHRTDRRSGAPVRHPDPMPRIRWYA